MAEVTVASGPGELWPLIHEQRHRLGDVLATLDPEEWEAPSLCRGWRVRDVAAHCIQTHLVTPRRALVDWARSSLSLRARNARGVVRRAALTPHGLLSLYRNTEDLTNFVPGRLSYSLLEAVIHGEDIVRAVQRRVPIAPRSLVTVASIACTVDPMLGGRRRSAGLALRATDVAWSLGAGAEVAGPLASIILAVTGRAAGLEDLGGEGLDLLRARLQKEEAATARRGRRRQSG